MATLNNIRIKLQEAIKQSGLTQTELAKKIGVHYSAIGQYLSGRSMPALDTLAKLCAVLDLDANEILCVSEFAKQQ
ncbi:MAG: helix-turn-helix domain-containing protein [Clostridia bacterium]|nr:helix-turn-helix domain-containing protein [Clostridia bacterium]